MTEPHNPRARAGSAGERTADFFTGAEQFVDIAVFHRSVAVAHGLFATRNGALDGVEVFLSKGHISVSSGNRWWSYGVEGELPVAIAQPGQRVVVRAELGAQLQALVFARYKVAHPEQA